MGVPRDVRRRVLCRPLQAAWRLQYVSRQRSACLGAVFIYLQGILCYWHRRIRDPRRINQSFSQLFRRILGSIRCIPYDCKHCVRRSRNDAEISQFTVLGCPTMSKEVISAASCWQWSSRSETVRCQ